MATALASAAVDAVFSYAGRTANPVHQPLPIRIGGFGGVDGLTHHLSEKNITHVIDATHPFAAGMSGNAVAACEHTNIPLIRLERPAWSPQIGDTWQSFAQIKDVPAALPRAPARIFLAIGKQHIADFASRPEHHYLLRLVDAPEAPLPLPDTSVVLARGPFDAAGDRALMEMHQITHIVAKNSGGAGAVAKLEAARALGLPVFMVERPVLPAARTTGDIAEVMRWLDHEADLGV